ncbi:MAG: glycosyltransferase family 8 protein [Oscillospiraceae bacterium]|jgi:lipopolysaccharide biosynthesis glycosyltransferase|nr:glycosyltransferase family 8 protein [Oscillospiraceae bacterium]
MNILVSIDRGYVTRLRAMIHSLYLNNAQSEITLHLLHSALTPEDIGALSDTARKYGGELAAYTVSDAHRQVSDITKKYPPEAFYRLLCADYLPKGIKRVLYLDGDIIVNGSLESLYGINLTQGGRRFMFAAATDPFNYTVFKLFHKQRLGLPIETEYVNTGVLLIDVEMLRETVSAEEITGKIPKYRAHLKLPDQDLFNVLFYKDVLHIDPNMYNYCPALSGGWMNEFRQGYPAIIHFAGPDKPWDTSFPTDNIFAQKAKALYDFYAAL